MTIRSCGKSAPSPGLVCVITGRGIGTQMRAAALHLAFAGLGATNAVSGAFEDNVSSLRVSEKLGYEHDGIERLATHGRVTTTRRLRLTRDRWQAADRMPVAITGLAQCLSQFWLPSDGLPERQA